MAAFFIVCIPMAAMRQRLLKRQQVWWFQPSTVIFSQFQA
jgi:hypothetical protein